MAETQKWGERFAHVHIKGVLQVNGERVDDPPAGMDQTNWGAFMALLYQKGYDAGLSIEPHSEIWKGELGEKGIRFTIDFIKKMIL
jgi:sugar phosphate isomerase/epimerase